MDKLVSAPTKVLNVLSPTGSAKSVESMSSEPDAPKEYRNLLMDMSDGKSDHIMWINCLKSYDWYGEGNFSFNMDKFGVPVLKNGDYKLNLSIECVDRYVDDSETDHNGKHLIYWEGNYWTPTEDDCIIVPVQTQALLVNKAANVLKTLGVGSGDTVLVISPFIIQIPIILMATIRIGAVFSLFNATNKSDSDLSEAILLANSKVVITADCFWYGGSVINVKRNVDAAMEIVKEKTEVLPQIVVIQHGAPNPGLPPIPEENRVIGRRPIYGVEVPFDPENEFRWSDLMLAAEENCIPKLMDTEDLMIKNIRKRND
uniref:AMP-dependent synthetase/ligase domain-containing protein n=1 Tax=Panagrolaimus sp. JU765 TaxID=591449 RepID=A0AC34PUM3_9BILA